MDPDGNEWEVYHLNFDVEEQAPAEASSCCPPPAESVQFGKRSGAG